MFKFDDYSFFTLIIITEKNTLWVQLLSKILGLINTVESW